MSQADIIALLLEHEKMTRPQIAQALIKYDPTKHVKWTYNNISAYLIGLHKWGLVKKIINPNDKRQVYYCLVDKDEAISFLNERHIYR